MNSIKRYFSVLLPDFSSKKMKFDAEEHDHEKKKDKTLSPNSIINIDITNDESDENDVQSQNLYKNSSPSMDRETSQSPKEVEDPEDELYQVDEDMLESIESEDEESRTSTSAQEDSDTVDQDFRKWASERSPEEKPSANIDTLIQKAVYFVNEMEKEQEQDLQEEDQKPFTQPKSLTAGKLYPYQIEGIRWMKNLFENGSHGLLADEMGLGKTIQVIGLYAYLREQHIWGPVLIVAPLSTLGNWVQEFHKWTPDIKTILYHGDKEEREELRKELKTAMKSSNFMNRPVLITSYDICRLDEAYLKQWTWFYIVVDEGHRLKNHQSALLKVLFTFAHHPNTSRLLLTGTPLQNNLKELWSLLNFLLPDVFVSPQQFITWFDFSQTKEEQYRQHLINTFRQVLSPFFLRRTKQEINIYLPLKREFILYIDMTETQKKLYNIIYKQGEEYIKILKDQNCSLLSKSTNNIMMRLRQCCCHPSLIYEEKNEEGEYTTDELFIKNSGKLHMLDVLLSQLYKDHHRVLLFTQFKEMIHLFEDYLSYRKYKYAVLDGSTSQEQRQKDINAFSKKNSNLFIYILTTRAGGQGINLSAADTCILYDSDWNPQMDFQAMDRCHRIGQKNPVAVYRFITNESIEMHMLKVCEDKKILEKMMTHKHKNSLKLGKLSYKEYKELIETNTIFTQSPQSISDKEMKRIAHIHAHLHVDNKGKGWELINSKQSTVLDTLHS